MTVFKTMLALALTSSLVGCNPEIGGAFDPDAKPSSSEPTEESVCDEAVTISFEQRTVVPDIMLILDKSGSMGDSLNNNNNSKWDVMRTAVASLVSNKGDQVNFGLMMYPWKNDCKDGKVRVKPALNSVGEVLAEMNSVGPSGKTPTHQSLRKARDYFDNHPINPDGRIVIIATDGLPVCSSEGKSVDEVKKLKDRDISTYVLGFGFGNANPDFLDKMARKGGTNQAYSADSPEQLSTALDSILGAVTVPSCNFELQATPSNDADINITVNGDGLTRDDPNGWSYDSASNTITLVGTACDSVAAGGASGIEVDLGCEGTTID